MANMSHCRFENTYNDLKECQDALDNYDSVEKLRKAVNLYEKPFVEKLVLLCMQIANEYGAEMAEIIAKRKS